MKTITIKQPWASLIISGIKDIENRTWACPKKYIGQRILIHASKVNKFKIDLTDEQMNQAFKLISDKSINGHWDFGAIIGSVQIVDCTFNHPSIWAEKSELGQDDNSNEWNKPIYNWVFDNPIIFPEPISCKGKLSFWDYPGIPELAFDEDGHRICMCTMNVKEENQVISMMDHFECRYCGGRWYK